MSPGSAATEPAPFDSLAGTYDETFSRSTLGMILRGAVQGRIASCFGPGDRVLELNCGTGEDALFLARRGVRVDATDLSPAMVDETERKIEATAMGRLVSASRFGIEELDTAGEHPFPGPYDGALSNFGGLNCVEDLESAARGLAARLRTGGCALLCVMGPFVPWEWAWYLARGRPLEAFRRLRPDGVAWRGQIIRYPRIGTTVRAFSPWFRLRRKSALGALLPPTYAESWASRHSGFIARLDRLERAIETAPWLASLSDHYLLELERR